jgi:hypothetical protein
MPSAHQLDEIGTLAERDIETFVSLGLHVNAVLFGE